MPFGDIGEWLLINPTLMVNRKGTPMVKTAGLFSQLFEQVSRKKFEKLVARHDAEYGAKGFTCWSHFMVMLCCQLAHADSLREICNGLACCQDKLSYQDVASGTMVGREKISPQNT